MKNLLIISGTPKTEGITYEFVKKAEKTADEIGLKFETIHLARENLKKCKMCADGWGVCFSEHYCVFGEEDGFSAMLKKVAAADALIFITPVYWGEVSEEMKIFIDKLRRCEGTKKWDEREDKISFLKRKPSIIVANAGGGGGGITTTFEQIERALLHMEADAVPREKGGVFDLIAVNRWNAEYKLETLKAAISLMHKYLKGEIKAMWE